MMHACEIVHLQLPIIFTKRRLCRSMRPRQTNKNTTAAYLCVLVYVLPPSQAIMAIAYLDCVQGALLGLSKEGALWAIRFLLGEAASNQGRDGCSTNVSTVSVYSFYQYWVFLWIWSLYYIVSDYAFQSAISLFSSHQSMKSVRIFYFFIRVCSCKKMKPYHVSLSSLRLDICFHVCIFFVRRTFRDANMHDTLRLKFLLRSCQCEHTILKKNRGFDKTWAKMETNKLQVQKLKLHTYFQMRCHLGDIHLLSNRESFWKARCFLLHGNVISKHLGALAVNMYDPTVMLQVHKQVRKMNSWNIHINLIFVGQLANLVSRRWATNGGVILFTIVASFRIVTALVVLMARMRKKI